MLFINASEKLQCVLNFKQKILFVILYGKSILTISNGCIDEGIKYEGFTETRKLISNILFMFVFSPKAYLVVNVSSACTKGINLFDSKILKRLDREPDLNLTHLTHRLVHLKN